MQKEKWVIGDIHGEFDLLKELISKLPKDADICFTGDIIDRGEKSFEVIKFIMENGYDCVLGNHELMMNQNDYFNWIGNGGENTLESFERRSKSEVEEVKDFIASLPYFKHYNIKNSDPLVVSHSYIHDIWNGKDFNYDEEILYDMTWNHIVSPSQLAVEKEKQNKIYNIFGHTVVKKPIVNKHWTMIDTGGFKKSGTLSAICYPTMKIISAKKKI